LVKDLRYDNLNIADDDHAIAAFAKMVWGECSDTEIGKTRHGSLEIPRGQYDGRGRMHEELVAHR